MTPRYVVKEGLVVFDQHNRRIAFTMLTGKQADELAFMLNQFQQDNEDLRRELKRNREYREGADAGAPCGGPDAHAGT